MVSTVEPPAGPAAIDPRIRARRIEVQRGVGRRRLQRVVEAGAVLVVGLLFLGALHTPLLDVDEVRIRGTEHLDGAAVQAAADIGAGEALVSVDLAAAGQRIAALPWVEEVALHRRLDGTVDVAVSERTPVATAISDTGPVLLDVDGRVLGPVSDAPGTPVVELIGLQAVPTPGGYVDESALVALAIAERLAAGDPGVVRSLEVDELVATLAQGGAVRFGDDGQLDAKLRSLHTVLDQVDLACLAVIDLRLPGSPVLTREEGCS